MRPITWAAALLALFVATEAKAQHYTIAKPIYMPHQLHDPCSVCGAYCNGSCSLRAFFTPTVTVNGCPYATSDPCSHSIIDELACDIQSWIYTRQAIRGSHSPGGKSGCGCGPSSGSCSDGCTPWDLTSPPQRRDEDVDPFRDDSADRDNIEVYHISSPELDQTEERTIFQDRAVIREASFDQDIPTDIQPLRSEELHLFMFTSPYGARSMPPATMPGR